MKLIVQIGIVFLICFASVVFAQFIPLPATIVGMILMFMLLLLGVLKVSHIKEKSEFLLKNMAFFFIPAGVEIMNNMQYIKGNVFALLFICFITMIITFAVTAYTVIGVMALQNKIRTKKEVQ